MSGKYGLTALLSRYLSGLRHPWILALVAIFFVVDMLVPDVIPFADEVLLGLLTLLLAAWRKRKDTSNDAVIDSTAENRLLSPNGTENGADTNETVGAPWSRNA